MVADPRFERRLQGFLAEWLGYQFLDGTTKNDAQHPWYDDAVIAAMQAEIEAFVRFVLDERGGAFEALLASQEGHAPDTLPEAYAGDLVEEGRVRTRAGLALLPGVISARSGERATKPMKRAQLLLERLYCVEIHAPDDVDFTLAPSEDEVATERERFEQVAEVRSCAGCHGALNPIGFALESYDAAGVHRTHDGDARIDPSGSMGLPLSESTSFEDAVALMRWSATSVDARACFVRNVFEATFGVAPDAGAEPTLRATYRAFEAAGFDVREVFVALAGSEYFLVREAAPAGGGE